MSTVRIVTGRPLHRLDRGAVGLELLVLAGQLAVAVHEQELAAEQADADRAGLERGGASPGSSMLASSSTALAVERDRRRVAQPRQARALELALALAEAVLLEHDRRRVDDDDAGVAVDDDPVVLADQAARLARADHRRDVHAARDDRGVRGLAADVGDEAGEDAALELQHVGRRDVVGDQHQRILAAEVARADAAAPAAKRRRRRAPARRSSRSTTCSRSALRSRRYSSSISSNWRASTSSCADSAHSAL